MFGVPRFRYPGGKANLRKWIIQFFPKTGHTYVEPFAGRGNVFFLARTRLKFDTWHLNDLVSFRFLKSLQVDPQTMERSVTTDVDPCRRLKHWEEKASMNDPGANLILARIKFSGGLAPWCGMCTSRFNRQSLLREHARAYELMRGVRVTCLDWKRSVQGLTGSDFVYLDPPYYGVNLYDRPFNSREMSRILARAGFRWVLSDYVLPETIRMYGDPVETKSVTRSMARRCATKHNRKVEGIWSNV